MEQLELKLEDPFAVLREDSPLRDKSQDQPIKEADKEKNTEEFDLEKQILQAEAKNQDVVKKRMNRIADNSEEITQLSNKKLEEDDESSLLYQRAAIVKPVGNNRRLTLKDINLLMPEENSSLESEEDNDKYLDNLLEQDKLTKLT